MAVNPPTTANLGLPLAASGHVQLMNSFRAAMVLIDTAIAALQSGSGIAASEILYDSGDPGDSNSTPTTLQGALDALAADINALTLRVTEIEGGNSNSP